MTIAISLKVNDGLVLAADSASTLTNLGPTGEPTSVVNVYEHANKIFNLRKGLPIGAITWGSGNIGNASISTLAKDLRRRFMGQEPDHEDWHIDPSNYSIREIADRVRQFMYEEHYLPSVADWPETVKNDEGEDVPLARPELGFIVAGYSPGKSLAENFRILIENGNCAAPKRYGRPRMARGRSGMASPRRSLAFCWEWALNCPLCCSTILKLHPSRSTRS